MSLEQAVKASTLVAGAVYAANFIAYEVFYSTLGLRPEDVGVGYVFVLTRSLGFILISLVVVTYLTQGWRVALIRRKRTTPRSSTQRSSRVRSRLWLMVALVWVDLSLGFMWFGWARIHAPFLLSDITSFALTLGMLPLNVGVVLLFVNPSLGRRVARQGAVFAGVVGVVIGLAVHANKLADTAMKGREVKPAGVIGLPVLDVAAKQRQLRG